MGELLEQMLSGGPELIPLKDLPEVQAAIFGGPRVRWELYRASCYCRRAVAASFSGESLDLLHWAAFERIASNVDAALTEDEARYLASMFRGNCSGVTLQFATAMRGGIAEAIKHYGLSPVWETILGLERTAR